MSTRAAALAALLAVSLATAAAPAGAKTYRGSGFRITAPAGFRLTQPARGVHVLSCGSAARVGFARWHGSSTPLAVARALAAQAGMTVLRTVSTRGRASVLLSGTDARLLARHGGASVTKSGRTLTARYWRQTTKGTGCTASGARAASLIDDLARAAASADGGGLADIGLKAITSLANPPVALTRYEVCAQTNGSGQPPCTSALVPDAWFPNLAASPGTIEGIGTPATGLRGEFVFGGVAVVYQNTCYNPFGNANHEPEDPYTGDPARAATVVFPQQWETAVRESPRLFTSITNATIVQALRTPWLTGVGPSGLYVMRWTQDGKPWTGLVGTVVANTGPDACYWTMYFSMTAIPDDAPAGLGTSLLTTWSSWRNSYQPVNGLRARGSSSSAIARAAQAEAQGDALPEVRRGGVPRFSPRFVRSRQPDLAAVVGR